MNFIFNIIKRFILFFIVLMVINTVVLDGLFSTEQILIANVFLTGVYRYARLLFLI